MDGMEDLVGRTAHAGQMVSVSDYQVSHMKEKNFWLFGVVLAVCGTLVGTVGKQMIRRSEMFKQERREKEASILFIVGLSLQVVLNPACDLAGYALAPATVIAPVTGMDIVWNTIIAPCSLNETLTTRRLWSTIIIFFAATASVAFRQVNEVDWTTDYVHKVLTQNRTMLYAVCFVGWFAWNMTVQHRFEKGSPIRGFSLGATAGTLSGNMWCTKIVAVLLEQCIQGNCEVWHSFVSWFSLLCAVFFATSNLYFISRGMQQHEALFMVTVYMGANITTNSLSAIIVLGEMDDAKWWKLIGYIFCIAMMMVGMALLTSGEKEMEARDLADLEAPCAIAEGPLSPTPSSSVHGSSVQMRTIRCNEGI